MLKYFIFLWMGLLSLKAFADPVPPRLMRHIQGHHAMRAHLQKGVFRITTVYDEVSYDTYEKAILNGVCASLKDDPKKGWGKAWLDRVEYLNRSETQGYTLVEAKKTCLELQNIDSPKEFLLKKTGACLDNRCQLPE